MSQVSLSTDELLAAARQGDRSALERLWERCRSKLLAKVAAGQNQAVATAEVTATLHLARDLFRSFHGKTEGELLAWLENLMPKSTIRPASPAVTSGNDETLARPLPMQPKPGSLPVQPDLSGETLMKPASAAPPPPKTGSTEFSADALTVVKGQDFGRNSPAMSMPPSAGAARAPVRRFGNYDLIDTIAKGGMGIVYKARHVKLNRTVALKMILSGKFADDYEVQRFYSEAEAAAKLRHPNIVGIHDVGECEGQHYFSMDYIEGKSLGDLLKDQALKPKHAAELLEKIAAAMHYAHTEGVVHRDLKPSNVLLDVAGSPLVTDFGLAKQVSSGGGQSQMTMAGTVVGTPSYMPPEQAAGRVEEIGIRSDVYSLGAILYELLSGRPPFRGAGVMETLKQVIENEPVALRVLSPAIPRDLETICHKCLQKEPEKRYQTAKELADELGRYLRGEPILAQPISPIARGWRWCKRNPVVATTSFAALLALVFGFVSATVGYVQVSAALAESEVSRRQAMAAVDDLFTQVSENTLLNKPGLQPLRKELLGRALSYYQRFLTQRSGDPRVRDELASAHFRIALITEAIESTDQALPLYETARAMQERLVKETPNQPARLEAYGNTLNALGTAFATKKQHAEAQRNYTAAAEVRTKLIKLQSGNSEYQRLLANTYMNLGLSLRGSGDTEGAQQRFEQAQQIRADALGNDPENWKLRRDLGKGFYGLGNLARQQGDNAAAQESYRQAATEFEKIVKRDPSDLENRRLVSVCYRLLGDLASASNVAEARDWYNQSRSQLKPLADQNPDVVDYRVELAGLELNRGYLDSDDGKLEAALEAFSNACEILTPLGTGPDALPRHRRDLAVALRALGSEQLVAGKREDGLANLRRAKEEFTWLTRDFPKDPDYAQQLEEVSAQLIEQETSPAPAASPVRG